ncbi:MAG: GGDEF domain-containing response regulator [Gammaproteobacteria bacterium]|nr:GGDEF domain-containing response regulator [Gammaproteobacteria bacterium]
MLNIKNTEFNQTTGYQSDFYKEAIKLLVIEDNEDDAILLEENLKSAGLNIFIKRIWTLSDLQEQMLIRWDAIISDHSLPGFTSTEALTLLKDAGNDMPFIIVSGEINESSAIEAMRNGARDYIFKDNLSRLVPVLKREVIENRNSSRDEVTGLYNRDRFRSELETAIKEAKNNSQSIALAIFDLDRFKLLNEALGFRSCDLILKDIADRFISIANEKNNLNLARLGGDEFGVIIKGNPSYFEISSCINKLMDALKKPFRFDNIDHIITVSTGIAIYPDDASNPWDLLSRSEHALLKVKKRNGNGFEFFKKDMAINALKSVTLHNDLHHALTNDEFELYYQPQYDLQTKRICGAEALIRWHHPAKGILSPGYFIAEAESTGMIEPIGTWALRSACNQIKLWQEKELDIDSVSVNISARQLQNKDFISTVNNQIKESGIDPFRLELELTESSLMNNGEESLSILNKIRELGVRISIDDFGTGYSSLSYLKEFPVDVLKIDRAFINELETDSRSAAITKSIISLANNLNLKAIAEGIETQYQEDFLLQNGCQEAQGFMFSKPIPADSFEILLMERNNNQ